MSFSPLEHERRLDRFQSEESQSLFKLRMYRSILIFLVFIIICSVPRLFLHANVVPELHEPFDVLNNSNDLLRRVEYLQTEGESEKSLNCSTYVTEEEFAILNNGSLFLPLHKRTVDYDSYFLKNGSAYFCDDFLGVQTPSYNLSQEFTTCGKILLDPDEFERLQNDSIYVEVYLRTYEPTDYLIGDKGAYICLPSFEDMQQNRSIPIDWHKFSKSSDYVTFIGLLISIISLLSHLIVFCFVSAVRNLPGYCLASLSLALLMAYLCFLTAFFMESETSCAGLGMCVYYFFLTSFFWMNAIAFDVWRSFRVVMKELRISSHRVPWRRFLMYSLYSWAIPALLTVMVKFFDSTDLLPVEFRPAFGHPFCWFGQRKALLVFFAVPLIVVMMLNIVFFADVIYVINRATMKNSTDHDANLKKRFAMFTKLALIMGLTWLFGIAAGFADKPVLWYIFIILNTLQGLFIFAVFMGSSKVRSLCFKEYKNRGKRTSTSVRTISAAL